MKAEPQVSVVLANWNGAQFLESALASVMAQTFTPWEFLVVDTGSTDASVAIIRHGAASDGRIRPIFIPQKWNCPAALNLALAAARGEWIARIESDDVWRPERLERQIEFLRAPGRERVGVCGSDARLSIGRAGS